ncbi:MAG: hypothetical protein LUE11_11950 [Clostridia bacterium]|nr:hypothetical protein [Clostridia bacterium]
MKRGKIIFCTAIVVLMLIIIGLIYYNSFPYADTDDGYIKAVEDSLRNDMPGLPEEAQVQVLASQKQDNLLYLFFSADTDDNLHGIIQMERSILGTYRYLEADYAAFPYTEGGYYTSFAVLPGATEAYQIFYVIGADLSENSKIRSFRLDCAYTLERNPEQELHTSYTLPADSIQQLLILSEERLQMAMELQDVSHVDIEDIRCLDADGEDITDQYLDPGCSVEEPVSGIKSLAERGLYRIYIAFILILGAGCIIGCLRQK